MKYIIKCYFLGYSLFSDSDCNVSNKKTTTPPAQKKMYSIVSHLVIFHFQVWGDFSSLGFFIILGVFKSYSLLLKSSVVSVTYIKSSMLSMSHNLTIFVIECIFVGYAMKERGGKQKNRISCSYLVYCLLRATKLNLKRILNRNLMLMLFCGLHTSS